MTVLDACVAGPESRMGIQDFRFSVWRVVGDTPRLTRECPGLDERNPNLLSIDSKRAGNRTHRDTATV